MMAPRCHSALPVDSEWSPLVAMYGRMRVSAWERGGVLVVRMIWRGVAVRGMLGGVVQVAYGPYQVARFAIIKAQCLFRGRKSRQVCAFNIVSRLALPCFRGLCFVAISVIASSLC